MTAAPLPPAPLTHTPPTPHPKNDPQAAILAIIRTAEARKAGDGTRLLDAADAAWHALIDPAENITRAQAIQTMNATRLFLIEIGPTMAARLTINADNETIAEVAAKLSAMDSKTARAYAFDLSRLTRTKTWRSPRPPSVTAGGAPPGPRLDVTV